MKVSSCYTVYGFDDINDGLKIYVDIYGCKVLHHPELPGLNYYIVEDANGNRTDLVSGNGVKSGDSWIRINVDNLDDAIAIFSKYNVVVEGNIIETKSCKMAFVKAGPTRGNCVVFEHKK